MAAALRAGRRANGGHRMVLKGRRVVAIGERTGVRGAAECSHLSGARSPTGVKLAALTLRSGDPSSAGPLAGVGLKVPTFHILEPEIMAQGDPPLVEREWGCRLWPWMGPRSSPPSKRPGKETDGWGPGS